tara:strand:- start:535 stop:2352 length:1818 start_codon:yes stop_codon:yes gene_type:complete
MAQATIEDLAEQLTEVSDKFVASFQNTMEIEDQLTSFLRGRQRWYVGTQQNSQTGSTEAPPVPVEQAAPQQAAPTKKRRCPKPRRVKTSEKEGLTTAQKLGIVAGVGLIVAGVAIALSDGPQPGPADAIGLPIIIQGANKIVPFIRVLAPVGLAKGGLVTKPTRALIGEAGPEIVVPMHKFGETIKDIYKQSAKALLEATAGFLASQPNNTSKGKLLGEISKLKAAFGLGALKLKQSKFGLRAPIKWWNKGRNERVIDENNASWSELLEDDMAQRGQSDESFAAGEAPPLLGRPDQAFNPFRPAEKGGPGSGPTPAVRQAFERPVRGLMNLGKGAAGAIGGFGKTLKAGMDKMRKAIPVPRGNGRDLFGQKIELNPSTESGWKKAVAAAARDGVDLPGAVTSAFRSNAEQAELVKNEDDPRVINPAPVGQSPHQQGWSIDIAAESPANQWMQKNGKKYGFEWEGPTDPVHFDFKTNESRTKFLQPGTQGAKPAAEGAAKNLGGKLLKGVLGIGKKLIGDPVDIQSTEGITSPEPSPEQTMINETPVEQSTKNGTTVVPIAAPVVIQQTQVVPLPPQDLEKLDPEIKRYYVVDQFSKATRVEMAYV